MPPPSPQPCAAGDGRKSAVLMAHAGNSRLGDRVGDGLSCTIRPLRIAALWARTLHIAVLPIPSPNSGETRADAVEVPADSGSHDRPGWQRGCMGTCRRNMRRAARRLRL